MRILVPVDGSENSMHAVEFIASRTTLLGSNPEIEVLNVQLPLPARACRLVGQQIVQIGLAHVFGHLDKPHAAGSAGFAVGLERLKVV